MIDVKETAKRLAARRGMVLGRQIPVERQAALFDTIKPMRTQHELIRIGNDADGGYLVPDDLDGLAACFSPGVDTNAAFEEGMIARGIRCFQADASVEQSPLDHPLVEFQRKFLGIVEDERMMTLASWVRDKAPESGDLILQMDIEGAEWLVLAATPDEILARFRIMLIEFHGFHHVVEYFPFDVIDAVFRKLAALFEIVHVHPNNCTSPPVEGERFTVPGVMEYSFLRKDRVTAASPAERFPHPLDRDNADDFAPIVMPRSLYGGSISAG